MPTYIGFSTIGANKPKSTNVNAGVDGGFGGIVKPIYTGKKYRLVDEQLVIQDFVNALNIKQGEKVGQPGYGTVLWGFVFEPNTSSTSEQLVAEIRRVAGQDPRMHLNTVDVFTQDNGILVQMEMSVLPFNNPINLGILLNNQTNAATVQ